MVDTRKHSPRPHARPRGGAEASIAAVVRSLAALVDRLSLLIDRLEAASSEPAVRPLDDEAMADLILRRLAAAQVPPGLMRRAPRMARPVLRRLLDGATATDLHAWLKTTRGGAGVSYHAVARFCHQARAHLRDLLGPAASARPAGLARTRRDRAGRSKAG